MQGEEQIDAPGDTVTFENMYFALLGAAEDFRTAKNPDIRKSIHCLEAILICNPPSRIEVRTRLQIAHLMWMYTKNLDYALEHLQKALSKVRELTAMEEVKLEITSLLASVYMKKHKNAEAVKLLNETIELAINYQFWYCQMCFQLAKANMDLGNISAAVTTLAAGAEYAGRINAQNTRILFSLSQAMALLVQRNFDVADVILKEVGVILENAEQSGLALTKAEVLSLKVFHHVLQVSEYIWQGMIKSARQCLKQLHSCYKQLTQLDASATQTVVAHNTAEAFYWMSPQQLFLLVYVVSVMHALQQGYTDKAESYALKALHLIEKQRTYDNDTILSAYQLILLEQLVLTYLLHGNTSKALKELHKCTNVYQKHHTHLKHHRVALHTALGLYAMVLPDGLDNAQAQFTAALKHTAEPEQIAFIKLNSAIVHLKQGLPSEQLHSLLESIEPSKMPNKCHSLKASSYCIQGIAAMFEGRLPDAKRKLRETVVMANKADLNKLTGCAFLLLASIFMKMGNYKDAIDMVKSASEIAYRIPDTSLQLWSVDLLAILHGKSEQPEEEAHFTTKKLEILNTMDSETSKAVNLPEHNLLQWLDSEFPACSMSMV